MCLRRSIREILLYIEQSFAKSTDHRANFKWCLFREAVGFEIKISLQWYGMGNPVEPKQPDHFNGLVGVWGHTVRDVLLIYNFSYIQ